MSKQLSHSSREIITINIGGFGINIGQSTLEQYCVEQGISQTAEKVSEHKSIYDHSIHTTFNETSKGKYIHRSIFTDLIQDQILLLQNIFPYKDVINPKYLVTQKGTGACTNFSRGYNSTGTELKDELRDRIRLITEECDNLQGFILNHSISGGTGSGFGTLCRKNLAVDYKKKLKIGFNMFLDDRKSMSPIEIYNGLFGMHQLLENMDCAIILDNHQLYDICKHKLKIKCPRYRHYNALCNKFISNVTAPWRFSMRQNMDSFVKDMVVYPRIKFLISGMSPMIPAPKQQQKQGQILYKDDIKSLTKSCIKKDNFMVAFPYFDEHEDVYFSLMFNYRGLNISHELYEVNKILDRFKYRKSSEGVSFTEWVNSTKLVNYIEDEIKRLDSDVIHIGDKLVTMIGNNECFSRLVTERITKKYDIMYSPRTWIHTLLGEGMSGGEFGEAREDLGFLEKDYLECVLDYCSDSESEPSDSHSSENC